MKDKIEKSWLVMIGIHLGMMISDFIYEIRFSNEKLWQEFLLVTQNGINGYFMALGLMWSIILLITTGAYLYFYRAKKTKIGRDN